MNFEEIETGQMITALPRNGLTNTTYRELLKTIALNLTNAKISLVLISSFRHTDIREEDQIKLSEMIDTIGDARYEIENNFPYFYHNIIESNNKEILDKVIV